MQYDFTKIIDRHGKDSIAVDAKDIFGIFKVPTREGFECIPMWVADMNFDTGNDGQALRPENIS